MGGLSLEEESNYEKGKVAADRGAFDYRGEY
uniref:Uncharacterized protein n=1 Tax=Rhizophora mucronata TaxID=61149 RepID=A0A2P2IV85_RHIMU